MSNRRPKPVMTIVFWGAIVLSFALYGAWCVYDGWFNEGYPQAATNKWMAGGCLVAVAWVISQGVKEYRKVRRLAAGQGDVAQGDEAPSPADTSPDDTDAET